MPELVAGPLMCACATHNMEKSNKRRKKIVTANAKILAVAKFNFKYITIN